jgi:hypothetical protein
MGKRVHDQKSTFSFNFVISYSKNTPGEKLISTASDHKTTSSFIYDLEVSCFFIEQNER